MEIRTSSPINDDIQPQDGSPSSRNLRSRLSSRCSTASPTSKGGSVKEQICQLDDRLKNNENATSVMRKTQTSDKTFILQVVEELRHEMEEDMKLLREDMQKKLDVANAEIERLSKCMRIQKGNTVGLQEQCAAIQKTIRQVDDDVQQLANEVLGE